MGRAQAQDALYAHTAAIAPHLLSLLQSQSDGIASRDARDAKVRVNHEALEGRSGKRIRIDVAESSSHCARPSVGPEPQHSNQTAPEPPHSKQTAPHFISDERVARAQAFLLQARPIGMSSEAWCQKRHHARTTVNRARLQR